MKKERTYVGGVMVSVLAVVALSFLYKELNPLLIVAVFVTGALGGASFASMMALASPERKSIRDTKQSTRITGEVKWFRGSKGFGFIVPDGGGTECFVHRSAIEGGGSLSQGDRVEYEVTTDAKGREAADAVVKLSKE